MLRFRPRNIVLVAVALMGMSAAAFAYVSAAPSTGTASTGSASLPSGPAIDDVTVTGSDVAITFTPASFAGATLTYKLERFASTGGSPTGTATEVACTTESAGSGQLRCTNANVADGDYQYRLIATLNSWRGTPGAASAVAAVRTASSSTALTSSASPGKVGQSLTYTATVSVSGSSASPTGTVEFSEDGNVLSGCENQALGAQNKATCTRTYSTTGDRTIIARYSGGSGIPGSTSATLTQDVGKGDQTITFTSTPPAAPQVGTTYQVAAVGGGSGNAVFFSASGKCTINAASVTFRGIGACTITANQAGNAHYEPAVQAQQTVNVTVKGTQTISFGTLPDARIATQWTPTISTSSGLAISSLTASPSGVCSVASGTVSFSGAGTCTLTASQNGDADWASATHSQAVTVIGAWTFGGVSAPPFAVLAGTSSVLTYPAGTATGDLMLLSVVQNSDVAEPSTPPDWTKIVSVSRTGLRLTAYYRAAGSERTMNFTAGAANTSVYLARYSRAAGGPSPQYAFAGVAPTSTSASRHQISPPLTTSGTGATVISVSGLSRANAPALAAGTADWTHRPTVVGTGRAAGLADRVVGPAGTGVNGAPWTQETPAGDWAFITVAFR